MKEQFKQWADQLNNVYENNIYGHTAKWRDDAIEVIKKAAYFLQSLANISKDEPEERRTYYRGSSVFDPARWQVTKENRDWWVGESLEWQSKYRIAQNMRESAEQELAAASALRVNAEHTAELLREHNRQLAIGINSSNELVINKNMELMAKDEALAAKDARIKQLENSLLDKMTSDNQAMGLYGSPPLLMTHEQFGCILDLIRSAADEPTNFKRWNDCVVFTRKLLVGE